MNPRRASCLSRYADVAIRCAAAITPAPISRVSRISRDAPTTERKRHRLLDPNSLWFTAGVARGRILCAATLPPAIAGACPAQTPSTLLSKERLKPRNVCAICPPSYRLTQCAAMFAAGRVVVLLLIRRACFGRQCERRGKRATAIPRQADSFGGAVFAWRHFRRDGAHRLGSR